MNGPDRRRLARWEKFRNLGEEILQGIRDIKAGRNGRRFTVESFARARGGKAEVPRKRAQGRVCR